MNFTELKNGGIGGWKIILIIIFYYYLFIINFPIQNGKFFILPLRETF